MINGTTSSGFKFTYDERILSDWRFMELMAAISNEEDSDMARVNHYTRLVTMLLGEKQKKALLAFVAEKNDGFAPMDKVEEVLKEIMTASAGDEIKN